LACKDFIFLPISELASIKELGNSVLLSKIANNIRKLKGHAPGEKNLQSKLDLICHVATVRVARSAYSMANVILFQPIYYSLRIDHQKKIYFTHNEENNIRKAVRVSMFQKFLANKHL